MAFQKWNVLDGLPSRRHHSLFLGLIILMFISLVAISIQYKHELKEDIITYNHSLQKHGYSLRFGENTGVFQYRWLANQTDFVYKIPTTCEDVQWYHSKSSKRLKRTIYKNMDECIWLFVKEIETNRKYVMESLQAANMTFKFQPPKRYIMESVYWTFFKEVSLVPWVKVVHFPNKDKLRPVSEAESVSSSLRDPMFPVYMDEKANSRKEWLNINATSDLTTSVCPLVRASEVRTKLLHKFRLTSRIFLLIIPYGLVSRFGHVYSNDVYIISDGCRADDKGYRIKSTKIGRNLTEYSEVFVMTQLWSQAYYHFNVETFPRIMPYVAFLRHNPSIRIHVPTDRSGHLKYHLNIVGLNVNRVVSGRVKARVVYLPQGGGCLHKANSISLQLLSNAYLTHLSKRFRASAPSPRSIVLIERTRSRMLLQGAEIVTRLEAIAAERGVQLVVYSDREMLTLAQTQSTFYKAAMIVAPHGAGLANVVWARPPVAVVELQCERVTPCFVMNTMMLGHRYYGISPTNDTVNGGCENGINVNVTQLMHVVQYVLDNSYRLKT